MAIFKAYKRSFFAIVLLMLIGFSTASFAQSVGKLAIVIDDIGYHPKEDAAAKSEYSN